MDNYRIARADMCMSDPMPFSQHWEARVTVPIDSIEDIGLALQAGFSSLRPGDLVNICSFDKLDWRHLVETASYRIASCDHGKIEAVQVSETVKVRAPKRNEIASDTVKLKVVTNGNSYEVRDQMGNSLEVFVTEQQAKDFISHTSTVSAKEDNSKNEDGMVLKRGFQGKYVVKNKAGEILKEFPNKAAAEAYMTSA